MQNETIIPIYFEKIFQSKIVEKKLKNIENFE